MFDHIAYDHITKLGMHLKRILAYFYELCSVHRLQNLLLYLLAVLYFVSSHTTPDSSLWR